MGFKRYYEKGRDTARGTYEHGKDYAQRGYTKGKEYHRDFGRPITMEILPYALGAAAGPAGMFAGNLIKTGYQRHQKNKAVDAMNKYEDAMFGYNSAKAPKSGERVLDPLEQSMSEIWNRGQVAPDGSVKQRRVRLTPLGGAPGVGEADHPVYSV